MALDMEAKKIIVKTWTTVSGLRTAQADRGRHEADQKKTKGICGSPWVPIL
ncbi:hypothetical protein T4D_14321 [Trichinella pseudospiralis]|uniref:Uncharacterized protein n=1 Tax=Trichinella pseudospiralis TaxID=6337 RepID=A0A0V1FDN2_TRIPS|nr:hypothetical protein T4D_14321 [Trichinella pseudospiralis]